MKRAERAALVGIVVAVAVALRWGFVATAHQQHPLRADAGHYAQYAHNLLEHGTFSFAAAEPPPPDSFRSPGYPVFLAACRLLGGDGWIGLAQALQVALGAATVWLAYRLARRWLPFAPSLLAAGLVALSPHLVVAPAFVLTECLSTFVLTAGLLLFAAARARPGRLAGGGLVLGAAALCNETLLVVPLVLVALVASRRGWRPAVALAVAAVLPVAAWAARNATTELAHRGSERAVASISHGSYPGMVYADPRLFGFPYREDPEQPAFGASWSNLGEVLSRRVAAAPWRYASWYLLEKPVWLWSWDLVQGADVCVYEVADSPYERQPVMAATHWLMRALHAPLMLLAAAAAGVLAVNRRRRFGVVAQALGLVAVSGTLAYLPVIPDPRYLQPFRPAIFALAAAGACGLVAAVRRRLGAADAAADPASLARPAPPATN